MSRAWTQGLLNCCGDCGICCCGLLCPCCQVCNNANGLGNSGLLCCLTSFLVPCVPTFCLRQTARSKYGVDGSTCSDCAAAWCCTLCVNCQTAREIQERGRTQHQMNTIVINQPKASQEYAIQPQHNPQYPQK